ncbi:uncharacterized protein L969DRAFT_143306 [Mixia osmundae IAM 14324]|uniref:uncharacterized protein n=1 Tax=Mixia osmundae (strain CBS 9802 / IAM 14324 / JCM 22182 / KY 12970) TaxID=764103 RepID=UPI0004A55054|nr:uncharacterized protein L969DRAFT_143306 [Mixia osmundae IAM 14324]KEI42331.1 hypothetical protein L969DRAFT_143306 [Mixia osmundae IAM 14324]
MAVTNQNSHTPKAVLATAPFDSIRPDSATHPQVGRLPFEGQPFSNLQPKVLPASSLPGLSQSALSARPSTSAAGTPDATAALPPPIAPQSTSSGLRSSQQSQEKASDAGHSSGYHHQRTSPVAPAPSKTKPTRKVLLCIPLPQWRRKSKGDRLASDPPQVSEKSLYAQADNAAPQSAPSAPKPRMSKKTSMSIVPKNWKEYNALYSRRAIDVEDPPLPPARALLQTSTPSAAPASEESDPYDMGYYSAPVPEDEADRQRAVERLDLFTQHDKLIDPLVKPASAVESSGDAEADLAASGAAAKAALESGGQSFETHPAFRNIVQEAREMFGTKVSLLTVLSDDKQLFLAETGLGGMRETPRDASFCSHTILSNQNQGFVLLDTQNDWRFTNAPYVKMAGARFYAGVPLMAPDIVNARQAGSGQPIGTLCVIDDKPRTQFTQEERRKLVKLADMARREIDNWHRKALEAKAARMQTTLERWQAERQSLASIGEEPASPNSEKHPGNASSVAGDGSTTNSKEVSKFSLPARHVTVREERAGLQRVFDVACSAIGKELRLDLVYLAAMKVDEGRYGTAPTAHSLSVLGAYGMPDPAPSFDGALHLKAARSPERGLLYQNAKSTAGLYASGLLVPVEEFKAEGKAYVLGAFTEDPKFVFGMEVCRFPLLMSPS